MIVAAYRRVSDRRKQGDKWSLPAQMEAIARHCDARGWPDPTWYTETHSAKDDDPDRRPVFRRLLADARARLFDTLLIVDVDRFARSVLAGLDAAARLERAGVKVISLNDGDIDTADPDGEFNFTLKLMLARRENRIRSRKVVAAMTYRASQGLWHGNVPWGARLDAGRLALDPGKAEVLDWALREMARRPFAAVAAELNRRGEPTAHGNLWRPYSVEQWLGHADWLAHLPAPWPDLVARARARRPAPRTRADRRGHMLSGLLRCACGGLVSYGGTFARPDGMVERCARCKHWTPERPTGAGCPHRLATMAHYEALVTAWVFALPERLARVPVAGRDTAGDLAARRADLAERRELLGIALADRALALPTYRARLAELAREEAALPPPAVAVEELGAGLGELLAHWHDADFRGPPQNAGLRELVDHCVVTGRDLAVVPVPILAAHLGDRRPA